MKNYLTLVLILFFNVQIFSFENAEVLGDYVLYGNWELYSADSKSKDFFVVQHLIMKVGLSSGL